LGKKWEKCGNSKKNINNKKIAKFLKSKNLKEKKVYS
jgi:hypothetical protein